MINFTGVNCPVCGRAFTDEDDIVVCPKCGAPYHRGCYQEKGQCIFGELHEKGKEWAPPPPPRPPVTAEIKDLECPVCGGLNGRSSQLCVHCGAPLPGRNPFATGPQTQFPGQTPFQGQAGARQQQQPPVQNPYQDPYQQGGMPQGRYYGQMPFVFDPMGGVSPADTLDMGVSYGDASKLVKQNTSYYMPTFRYMKQTGRNKFNFCAFLFSGAWMLYRKQYKYGIVITVLMFLMYLLYLAASVFIATPALLRLMQQAGIDVSTGVGLTNEQLLVISQLITEEPSVYLELCLPMICLLMMLVLMIFTGVRGNKMYMRHCIATVRQVKSADLADQPTMTLDQKGGVNTSVAVCMFVCYFLLVNVVPLLL